MSEHLNYKMCVHAQLDDEKAAKQRTSLQDSEDGPNALVNSGPCT